MSKKLSKSYLEKYRPRVRKDIAGNSVVLERIFSQIDQGTLVNMILTGDSGLGKTTTAEIITKKIIGKDHYYTDCVLFNCSDKTGVENIRTEIIKIEKLRPASGIRVFFMEEAEQLSKKAQFALKKAMEYPYDKSNRFIFLSNNITKFISAIKDRCRIYYYMAIRPEEMFPRLKYIVEQEVIDISNKLLLNLAELSNGSMRYPIIQLEEFKALDRKITERDIQLEESLESIKSIFNLLKLRKIPPARSKILDLYQNGSNFNNIIKYFHDFTMMSLGNSLNYKTKAKCVIKIAETERNVNQGCNEFIQISFLLSNISLLLQKTRKEN